MLTDLEVGLDTLHGAIQLLRNRTGRGASDLPLMQFELALAEISANSLRYALPPGLNEPRVDFELKLDSGKLTALLTDWGPAIHNPLTRAMPAPTSEAGRGLAIAQKVLDELDYERNGEVNKWRLMKRL
jgi:serine/threonine-protein kinase RsbW